MGVNRDVMVVRDASARYDLQAAQPAVPVGYKQTEVGVIPEDWDIAAAAAFTNPSAPVCYGVVQVGRNVDGGVPIIAIKFVKEITWAPLHRTSFELEKPYVRSRVKAGDVLISIKGTIGRVGIVPEGFDGNISRELARLRPLGQYCGEYIAYQLESDHTQARISKAVVGTTRLEFSIATLRNFELPFPPTVIEQRAIATALSDVDALLEGLDRLIAKKRDLKQAAMQQLLTGQTRLPGFEGKWGVKQLGDLAQIVMGQSPNSSNYNSTGGGLPLIQGNADIRGRKTIKRVFTTQITKQGRTGDILMSVRAPVGEISRATFDVCLGRGVCALRAANDFLYHYLIYLEPSWAKHSKGSTFDSVNSTDIKTVEVRLPSDPDEQSAIATVLSDMDAELEALEKRRAKTAALKQAMMQELLTGRIRLVESQQEESSVC